MRYPAILAAAAFGAAAVFAAPAAAESVGIQYADLDLSTKDGQEKLERRIDSAARTACGMDKVVTGRFTPSTAQRTCYRETKTSVHDQIAQAIARGNTRG
jgi:UrcA family protein